MRRRSFRLLMAVVVVAATIGGGLEAIAAAERRAADVDMITVAVGDTARARTSRTHRLPWHADMLGASWTGAAHSIELRAATATGRWSRWVQLDAGDDAPDAGSAELRTSRARTGRRTASNPVWVGDAMRIQIRAHDGVPARDVRVIAINATSSATATERLTRRIDDGVDRVLAATAVATTRAPRIHTRASWNAKAPSSTPGIAVDGVRGAVVHHTAGTNTYSCAQVPAILRGIQRYHMASNGWYDIGYNFLIDKCGGVWEGRTGGLTRAVIGAHTSGFNTSTTGVALIGSHARTRPSAAARAALVRLLSWRLDVAHVKPTGRTALIARSSDKFPAGTRVVVRSVSGHRDLFPTGCPGALSYRSLSAIAAAAWSTGGPKLAAISTSYTRIAPTDEWNPNLRSVRVRAVSSAAGMYVTVRLERVSTGELLHQAATTRLRMDTTWTVPSAVSVPYWDVRVLINGARGDLRARGESRLLVAGLPSNPGLAITTPPPASVHVDGGTPTPLHVGYTLAQEYRLGVWLDDPITGRQVAELRAPAYLGANTAPRTLDLSIPDNVPAGNYHLRLGLPADPALGRSMHRYPLTITRP